jgi:hypothetical protein
MSLFYYVEVLNSSGDVQTRQKCSALPIRLGRGYNNDIILDDPHTAPEHAIIEHDEIGALTLRNLSSQNGIKIKGKNYPHIKLNGDTIAQLGHTHIRVRDSHYVVSAELSDSSHHAWQGWQLLIFSLLIIGALSWSDFWLDDIDEKKITAYITNILTWLLSAGAWAGLWALANRVFGKSANFNRHLLTLSCGMLALSISEYIYTLLAFSLSWDWPILYKGHIIIAIMITMIYYHLRLINLRKQKLLKFLCVGAAIVISGLKLMTNYQSTNKYADALYVNETLPPVMRISRNHSVEEFGQSIYDLKKELDTEREQALKEKALKEKSDKKTAKK